MDKIVLNISSKAMGGGASASAWARREGETLTPGTGVPHEIACRGQAGGVSGWLRQHTHGAVAKLEHEHLFLLKDPTCHSAAAHSVI